MATPFVVFSVDSSFAVSKLRAQNARFEHPHSTNNKTAGVGGAVLGARSFPLNPSFSISLSLSLSLSLYLCLSLSTSPSLFLIPLCVLASGMCLSWMLCGPRGRQTRRAPPHVRVLCRGLRRQFYDVRQPCLLPRTVSPPQTCIPSPRLSLATAQPQPAWRLSRANTLHLSSTSAQQCSPTLPPAPPPKLNAKR